MSRHTPGPWVLTEDGGQIVAPNAADRFGTTPVEVLDLTGAMGGDDTVADARLIAAAPDLLEALRDVLPDLQHYASTHGPGPDRRLDAARAAIARAEGRA